MIGAHFCTGRVEEKDKVRGCPDTTRAEARTMPSPVQVLQPPECDSPRLCEREEL